VLFLLAVVLASNFKVLIVAFIVIGLVGTVVFALTIEKRYAS
jgi:hypothetical protein